MISQTTNASAVDIDNLKRALTGIDRHTTALKKACENILRAAEQGLREP